jgi:carbonic anhydrase
MPVAAAVGVGADRDDIDVDPGRGVNPERQLLKTLTLIRERSPVMRTLEQDGKIRIVGSMNDIASGRVSLL